jgi:hypothetical protein
MEETRLRWEQRAQLVAFAAYRGIRGDGPEIFESEADQEKMETNWTWQRVFRHHGQDIRYSYGLLEGWDGKLQFPVGRQCHQFEDIRIASRLWVVLGEANHARKC